MRWVWIGDSILVDMANWLSALYVAARGDELFAYHETGWGVSRWLGEGAVDTIVRTEKPDVVVIALGTNDVEADQTRFVRSVKDLTTKAKAGGAKIVWIGPFNSTQRNVWGRSNTAEPWVDGMELAKGLPRTADGVHFADQETYKTLADRVVAAVDKALANKQRTSAFWLGLGLLAGGLAVAGMWAWRRAG